VKIIALGVTYVTMYNGGIKNENKGTLKPPTAWELLHAPRKL